MKTRDFIKLLLNYDMNAEIFGPDGEDIKCVEYRNPRNSSDIHIKFKQPGKTQRIVKANAMYTGGGIYCYYATLGNGIYLLGNSEWDCIYECDSDPECEESGDIEWCDAHIKNEVRGGKYIKYLRQWLKWMKDNKPSGNYQISDLEGYIAEELKGAK